MELAKHTDVQYAGAAVSAGSSIDNTSSRIDMANWEGVIFVTAITDSAATGVATLTVEQNSVDSDSGMAALDGAVHTRTSAQNDDLNGQTLQVAVHRPRERYVQAVRTSATANIAYGEIYAIVYGPRKAPTAFTGVAVVSPAES